MARVSDLRQAFLSFFAKEGHAVVASSPLVPRNDPTLMFTNAGMVQFKNVFTGLEKRPYSTAVTSQKCVRAGGKHNDLDNVGYTARHHTFFEMLGNFSFGDYFKERAIDLAWRFVTAEMSLPKDKLLVTVYAEDDEAHALWRKIAGLSDDKIIRIPTSDNFWAMGDTGPCGPCSEIFYDHGERIPGGPPGSADQDGDRFIEIWNLVFMQYEQQLDGERLALPRPSIDTGMGLERAAAVLQGTHDNYATDLMRGLIEAVAHATGVDPDGPQAVSHRVISDHLRSSCFLVTDGVLPSNEGRGYVLRRIMRRAMRHAELLGVKEPLMHKLVGTLVQAMGDAYPELQRAQSLMSETLLLEESRFRRTLERGLVLLDEAVADLPAGSPLSGDVAFKLYDTYGFPLDLTEDALRSRGLSVDTDGFAAAMERQRIEARKAWSGSGEAATDAVYYALLERVGATEFLGYQTLTSEAVVQALLCDGQETPQLHAGQRGLLLVNQTPFYAESGGQRGDSGLLEGAGVQVRVVDTRKALGALWLHEIEVVQGSLSVGDSLLMQVDAEKRQAIGQHHSATHLLHEALRLTLGDHVAQKGSLVEAGRLRFDFSQPTPLTSEQLAHVERLANAIVMQNVPVETRVMDVDSAMKSGARALFGEKYGDEVRVVSMGRSLETDDAAFSVELCGGTHVARTGDIGLISVLGESGVAAGVRRLEAVVGEAARTYLESHARTTLALSERLNSAPDALLSRVDELLEQNRKLEKALQDAQKKLAFAGGASAGADVETVSGVPFMAKVLSGVPAGELKAYVDEGKKRLGSGVVAMLSVDETGKAGLVVGVTPDLVARFDAVKLVRSAAEALGGKGGGGRPDMAQAGGPDGHAAPAAMDILRQQLATG